MTVKKLGETSQTRTCFCNPCKSLLVYEQADVQSVFISVISGTTYWIECSECGNEVPVKPWSKQ